MSAVASPPKERPILFQPAMVRAILADDKTQTRRIVKLEANYDQALWHYGPGHSGEGWYVSEAEYPDEGSLFLKCPYGKVGDRLVVKEAAWMWCERRPNGETPTGRQKWHYVPLRSAPILYAADHPEKPRTSIVSPSTGNEWGWRLKVGRFLPRWASRIALEITEVRVQLLQEISEADIIAEGCPNSYLLGKNWYRPLWESINGAGSWDANPCVWAITFKRLRGEA